MAHGYLASEVLELVAAYSPKCGSNSIRAWYTALIEEASGQPVIDVDHFLISRERASRCEDYWKVLFLRDPLRRLVGFYSLWVVRDESLWCFADARQRFPLRDKSFSEFLLALQHLRAHDLPLQHHLVPQAANLQGVDFDETVAVERLGEGLAGLNQRLDLDVPIPHKNRSLDDPSLRDFVGDKKPDWFRNVGVPGAEYFFDVETRALALELYAADVELYRRRTGLDILRAIEP